MFSYSGEAELIFSDGQTVTLNAVELREYKIGNFREWSGTALAAVPVSPDDARIKLPSGAEANVLVTNMNVSSAASGIHLTLKGTGAPPK